MTEKLLTVQEIRDGLFQQSEKINQLKKQIAELEACLQAVDDHGRAASFLAALRERDQLIVELVMALRELRPNQPDLALKSEWWKETDELLARVAGKYL